MTMLTHPGSRFKPASHRSGRRAPTTTANLAMLKLICLRAIGPLLTAVAIAGVIVLKAAVFLSRVSH
ncbi:MULTISPECIES: hypothetical protein [unclassified Bradyrhizobium]|uniref:hypothetical protein n=1 Tax=unclassified Bradyrhizobium TaxID=2631580 RepID=UPI001BA5A118|nr:MULTISPECIES: hypothetical protein [unclassified Bradyrhizobium]MBR1228693.1 hypothetical protein [Bradyrhizobium sp. AUGA SZCCT0176]MBR1299620.1 hypothetical protein [Bradyrhizobium sp. AUGA SZCCT0042]